MVACSHPRIYCTAASIFPSMPPRVNASAFISFRVIPLSEAPGACWLIYASASTHLMRHPLCHPEHALSKGSLCDATLCTCLRFPLRNETSFRKTVILKRFPSVFCAVSGGARRCASASWLPLLLRLLPGTHLQFFRASLDLSLSPSSSYAR